MNTIHRIPSGSSPSPGVIIPLGPLTLLCRRVDREDQGVTRLLALTHAEGLEPELEPIDEAPQTTIRRVVARSSRRLMVLCKTAGLDVSTRLSVKQAFVEHAGPSHWLTTARLDLGVELAMGTVLEVARGLLTRGDAVLWTLGRGARVRSMLVDGEPGVRR
ncbi:MAG: hypothetical protein H6712_08340 [Myxococcales bacterium]|nr:hypothetical protein [Myxococcales bacterium]MCB9713847.1 hypothetical protein [Myxococcales bacterium]